MVVDVSGSMANADFMWGNQPISRLEAVQKVFRLLWPAALTRRGNTGPAGRTILSQPHYLCHPS